MIMRLNKKKTIWKAKLSAKVEKGVKKNRMKMTALIVEALVENVPFSWITDNNEQ